MPLMFLGTFVPTGTSAVTKTAVRFVPTHYVIDALTLQLLKGALISSPTMLLDTAIASFYSIMILLVGVLLFERYGKS